MKDPEIIEPEVMAPAVRNFLPPAILQSMSAVPVPQMEYESSFVKDWLHNWKLSRMAKSAQKQREIEENYTQATLSKLEAMRAVITFSAELSDKHQEFAHRQKMRELEEREKNEDIRRKNYEATLLAYECTNAELEYTIKKREFDGLNQAQDRE